MGARDISWIVVSVIGLVAVVAAVLMLSLDNNVAPDISGFAVHPVYSGFALPVGSFSSVSDVVFGSLGGQDLLSFSVNDTVVYRTAYVSFAGSSWRPVSLSGSFYSGSSVWISGRASGSVSVFPSNFSLSSSNSLVKNNYVVVYSCTWLGSSWDCHSNLWQIRQFNVSLSVSSSCSGSSSQSCSVVNGVGTQSRSCVGGVWSGWGTCVVSGCDSCYVQNGNSCVVSSCSGSSSQSCSVVNGVGVQSRSCSCGSWSGWGSCTVSSCNSGYIKSGNTCIASTSSSTKNFNRLVIDHTMTDVSKIPSCWITKAKQNLDIAYIHTSHGSQLVSGMNVISTYSPFNGVYAYSGTGGANTLHFEDYAYGGFTSSPCGQDLSQCDGNILATTKTFLDSSANQGTNVIMWSWCNMAEHNVPLYLSHMQALIDEYETGTTSHPAPVKFIFMTGHAEGTGEGDSSDIQNNRIRDFVKNGEFCGTHDCILFDFSDMENYDPDGNYYLNKRVDGALDYDGTSPYTSGPLDHNWATEYLARHSGSKEDIMTDLISSCAHSPDTLEQPTDAKLNCVLKGEAAWSLWARLAGWNGQEGQSCPS